MVLGFKIPDPPAQGVEPALVCLAEDVPLVRSKVRVQVTVRVRVGIRVLLLRSRRSSIGFVLREGLRLRSGSGSGSGLLRLAPPKWSFLPPQGVSHYSETSGSAADVAGPRSEQQ